MIEPTQTAAGGQQPPAVPNPPKNRRRPVMMAAGIVGAGLGLAGLLLPAPYVIETPGPSFNTIGAVDSRTLIEIPGEKTYPTSGNLDLTTVYMSGGPRNPVRLFEVAAAWLDPRQTVAPEELVYPPGVTGEEIQNQNAEAMTSSQETSVAAALAHLGVKFDQRMTVVGFADNAAAEGLLKMDDVVATVNGKPITGIEVLRAELNAGHGKPVELGVVRDGKRLDVEVTPKANDDGEFQLGVLLGTDFDFPYDVKIQLDNVGGPSAGLMFALGIVDKLTPGEMTGGKHFAGTGTIDAEGKVGPIGGIVQKMDGARDQGATVFLAPAGNCGEVAGHVPDGMQVVKVENLDGAVKAVERIGSGSTAGLPSCG
ncbi:YlbL family protein [Arthrobacter mangrovi]|uniref:endopeptidase La n=1 Tax=Arthrobacter mangrovi TaxID=2966350 RepID=A0ABQ5MSK0_9MICC|nr:S16 family serine protease [Arthrobacter mangrovi]GLB66946.1 hypothetical protein AHIS1636_13850 [Arthrobacter mangrovi]